MLQPDSHTLTCSVTTHKTHFIQAPHYSSAQEIQWTQEKTACSNFLHCKPATQLSFHPFTFFRLLHSSNKKCILKALQFIQRGSLPTICRSPQPVSDAVLPSHRRDSSCPPTSPTRSAVTKTTSGPETLGTEWGNYPVPERSAEVSPPSAAMGASSSGSTAAVDRKLHPVRLPRHPRAHPPNQESRSPRPVPAVGR